MLVVVLFSIAGSALAVSDIPPGTPLTLTGILAIIRVIMSFLIIISAIIAVIAILVSGIIYMTAGSSDRVGTARTWLTNAIIGALIVFAVGVIINTIILVVTRGFFFSVFF